MNQDDILNFQTLDAFADAESQTTTEVANQQIHLRTQQRNGRKCITTVQGLPESLDLKRLIRTFKKSFNCNGTIKQDKDTDSKVIQMSGDQRQGVRTFLTSEGIARETDVIVHGA